MTFEPYVWFGWNLQEIVVFLAAWQWPKPKPRNDKYKPDIGSDLPDHITHTICIISIIWQDIWADNTENFVDSLLCEFVCGPFP